MHQFSIATLAFLSTAGLFASQPIEPPQPSPLAVMLADQANRPDALQPYKAKDFSNLIGMPGFSDNALNTHFKLYQGYVKNTNLLISILNQLTLEGKQSSPQFQELKRRFGWEFDGIRLHELYFDNLGGQGTKLDQNSPLYKRIIDDFGTFDAWKKDFIETGMIRGVGWAVLYQDPIEGRLINTWIGEHDIGHLAGGTPILIMDVWEHAFMLDYGIDRRAYIKAFFDNIQWNAVAQRYKQQ
jgi:Fe-Mn family superoxide dismutase